MKKTFPKRYDQAAADDGVEFNITDELGNEYGAYTCRFIDKNSPKTALLYKRINAKHAAKIKSKKMTGMEAVKVVFVEGCLVGWNVKDDDNKSVPFTPGNVDKWFDLEDPSATWLLNELAELAGDVTNYAPDEQVEDDEKN